MAMSKQKIFDTVKAHLLQQGQQSEDSEGCKYRGPGDLKCAIGCLIADEHYTPELEWKTPDHSLVRAALDKSGVTDSGTTPDDLYYLRRLQIVHDNNHPKYWGNLLAGLAKSHGLNNE